MKRRVKILVILGIVSLIGVGLFSIARGIVDKGYSSEARLIREEEEKREKQNKVSLPEQTKELGNHGENYTPGEMYSGDKPIYLDRLKDILSSEGSPYKDIEYTVEEQDLSNGEKLFSIKSDGDVVLEVYGNSVDYAPYMFVSKNKLTSEEKEFFRNLQNGEEGYNEETKEYYWLYY